MPGSSSAAGVYNMALVYTDARSVTGSEYLLTPEDWAGLIVQCEAPLFDAVLFTGYMWFDAACFWPSQCKRALNATDWRAIQALWLGEHGVRGLDAATRAAMAELGLGVEMELPLTVRNAEINYNSTTSFYEYLDNAASLQWYVPAGAPGGALKTWYCGNDFVLYARAAPTNATLARRLDDMRAFVNGDYQPGARGAARSCPLAKKRGR